MKNNLILFVLLIAISLNAQTLNNGDFAVVGFNTSFNTGSAPIGPDEFAIVALASIPSGTTIKLTDRGWSGSAMITANTGDGVLSWTTTSSIPAGTVFKFTVTSGGSPSCTISPNTYGTPSVTLGLTGVSSLGAFANVGDQMIIYQGDDNTPSNFVYGLNTSSSTATAAGNWQTASSSARDSDLPPGLTNNSLVDGSVAATALAFTNNSGGYFANNFVYTGTKSGTKNTLLKAIGNRANWTYTTTLTTTYDLNVGGTVFTGSNPVFSLISAPLTQATSVLLPSNAAGTQINVSWTNGSGATRAVFMKQGSGAISNPSDGNTYTASANWSSKGTQLGSSGYYCIYNGSGNSVSVTNTLPLTQYTVQVFEYNGTSGSEQYLTSTSTGNPGTQSTLPVELTSFSAVISGSSVKLLWQTASEINSFGFEIERSTAASPVWQKIGFVPGSGNSNSVKNYSFTDSNPAAGKISYRLKQLDNNGQYKYYNELAVSFNQPDEYKLMQNFPNPFNPTTAISFNIPVNSQVTLKIFDLTGSEVTTLMNQQLDAGSHVAFWNGSNSKGQKVSSGIYIYKLTAENYSESHKMNLLK